MKTSGTGLAALAAVLTLALSTAPDAAAGGADGRPEGLPPPTRIGEQPSEERRFAFSGVLTIPFKLLLGHDARESLPRARGAAFVPDPADARPAFDRSRIDAPTESARTGAFHHSGNVFEVRF